ncbi:unnamed protein product [Adineta steineri]|uniref:Uncharacterized protein n=1 Tax=Adineta steineri TaxID=433720 RepID=A0A813QK02_9BILA|nr:unnamed protein product [Adineta steineri]CAF0769273.1 unnamed protein product [Adineta steineri]
MASDSNSQPSFLPRSYLPIMNSSDSYDEITSGVLRQTKHRNIFQRFFGKLHATPFVYTDELKQYSINGGNVNNNGRTVLTKK